jgi:hypothetical protein
MKDADGRLCPICHTGNGSDATACHRCGWALTAYLGEPSAEEIARLREALQAARQRWWPAHPELVCQLRRHDAEDREAFQRFVAGIPPLPVGHARLADHDAVEPPARPRIELDTPAWLAKLAAVPNPAAVDCDPATARRLATDAAPAPIFARVGVQGDTVRIMHLDLLHADGAFPIIQAPSRPPRTAKPSAPTAQSAPAAARVRDGIGIGIVAVLALAYALAGSAIAMGQPHDAAWMTACAIAATTALLLRLLISRRIIVRRPWAADVSGMMLDEITAGGWGRLVGIGAALPLAAGYGLAFTDPASLPGGARLGLLTGLSAGYLAGGVVASCRRAPAWLGTAAHALAGAVFGGALGTAAGAIIGTVTWTMAEITGLTDLAAMTAMAALAATTALMVGGWWAGLATRNILAVLRP